MTLLPPLSLVLASVLCLGACSKPQPGNATASPAPEEAPDRIAASAPATVSADAPPVRPGRRLAPPGGAAEADAEARELAAEVDRESEQARRIEILYELALNGSATARETLEQLYRSTRDLELKTHAIGALAFLTSDDLSFPLRLLSDALLATQPPELRTAAVETLRELESPATLPVWRGLLSDANPEFREFARVTIEFLAAQATP